MWEGLEPIVQNENCIWETEAQYKSREWTESTRNDEVLYVSDEWPLRKAEIVRDEDGRDFLRITMRDGSGLMFVSTALPEGTTLQEDLAGDTTLLLSCPAENADDPEKAGEAEKISLTFILGEDDWYLVFATDNKEWAAEVQDGVWLFDDFETPGNGGEWQTEGEDRLTEFCFDDLTEMAEAYRQRLQMK